jgi:hypothetical protein
MGAKLIFVTVSNSRIFRRQDIALCDVLSGDARLVYLSRYTARAEV